MAVLDELKILITGDSSPLRRELSKAEARSEKMGRIGRAAGKAMAVGIAGAGVAAGVAAKEYADFSGQMAEVETLLGGNEEKADVLRDRVKELTAELGVSGGTAETAQGLYQTLSAGFTDTADASQILETSIKAAQVGLADTQTTVDATTTVLNAWGKEASEVGNVADVFQKTIERGKTTMAEFGSQVGRVAPVASELGISFEEVSAATATLTASGQNTDQVATGLRQTMTQLLKPSDALAARIEELGFTSGKALVEQEGLQGALTKVTEGMDEAEKAAAFPNVRAMQSVFPLVGEQADKFRENLGEVSNAAGTVEESHAEMQDSASRQLEKLEQTIRVALIDVGGEVFDVLREMASAFNEAFGEDNADLVGTIKDILQAMKPALVAAATALGTIAGFIAEHIDLIGPLAAGVFAAVGAFVAWSVVIPAVTAGMGALSVATLTALAPFAAIALAVAGLILLWQNWDTVTQVLTDTFGDLTGAVDGILGFFDNLLGSIQDLVSAFAGLLADLFSWIADVTAGFIRLQVEVPLLLAQLAAKGLAILAGFFGDALGRLAGWLADTLGRLADWVLSIWDTFGELERRALGIIAGWLGEMLGRLAGFAQTALAKLAGWVLDMLGEFASLAIRAARRWAGFWFDLGQKVASATGDILSDIAGFLGDLAGDLLQGAKAAVADFVQGFKQKWDRLASRITGVFGDILDAVPSFFEMWQAGKDIVEGLWAGVRRKWNEFVSWFEDRWEDLKDRFTDFFRIGSPSRLFRSFGEDIVAGLQQGLRGLGDVIGDELASLRAQFTVAADVNRGPRLAGGAVQRRVVQAAPRAPAPRRRAAQQGGGGPIVQGDVVIPVEVRGGDPGRVRDEVREAIRDVFERGGGFRA